MVINYQQLLNDHQSSGRVTLRLVCVCVCTANYFLECVTEQDIAEIDLEIIRTLLYKVLCTKVYDNLIW